MLFLYTKGQVLASIQTANNWGEPEARATQWLIACVCICYNSTTGGVIIDL